MYSLLIDTHDINLLIALYKDDEVLDKESNNTKNHASICMPIINDVLTRNNLDVHNLGEIIVVIGPGSFTGVRIGATIGKMLAYTLNIPIKVITSLDMYAISNTSNTNKLVLIRDLKGSYGAYYTSDNKIIDNYFYKSTEALNEYLKDKEEYIIDNEIDLSKVKLFVNNLEVINPHKVNPIYIKEIEANKDGKRSIEPRFQ
jgi:tRNA threonylcarbamoyl adenosine modification protein YeaZ